VNRRPVTSSNISSIGWENGDMEVEYNSGHIYSFHEVPEAVYLQVVGAESVGREMNNLRGRYQSTRVK